MGGRGAFGKSSARIALDPLTSVSPLTRLTGMPNAPHNTPTARNISTDLAECYAIELGGRLLGYAARRHGAPAFSLNLDNGTDLLASPATVAEAIDYIADASLLVDWCTRYSIPARWLTLAIQAAR